MNLQDIATFLEDARVQAQLEQDQRLRPRYRNNTWLKQRDLRATERIVMQLIDEIYMTRKTFNSRDLINMSGFSGKCIRETFDKLSDKGLIERVGTSHTYKPVIIL